MMRASALTWLVLVGLSGARAADVSGRGGMPDTVSRSISPAVVRLQPRDAEVSRPKAGAAGVALIRQSGLIFAPRVQALVLGQPLRLTNEDRETHTVHNIGDGEHFNMSMSP